jgi:hypothetical protein
MPLSALPTLRRSAPLALGLLGLQLAAACAGKAAAADSQAAQGARPARSNRNVITQEQMVQQHFKNAYEAVQALHPNWLTTRGTDSFRSPSQVWVYLDDARLGGIDQLSTIAPSTVGTIRHFNGVDASARWGLDHGAGVIQVISRVR